MADCAACCSQPPPPLQVPKAPGLPVGPAPPPLAVEGILAQFAGLMDPALTTSQHVVRRPIILDIHHA